MASTKYASDSHALRTHVHVFMFKSRYQLHNMLASNVRVVNVCASTCVGYNLLGSGQNGSKRPFQNIYVSVAAFNSAAVLTVTSTFAPLKGFLELISQ